ncbi:MAG: HAD family hydrolase [Lachnospiraceae bacterium]|nr:HAD family hydrolase [Lachnospiraceae bacterium]MDY4771324.1 HAD family hydrolase [Lachnospiraceae bacterium]
MIAIIFDVDDTLYDQIVPFQNACRKILGRDLENAEEMYRAFSYWGNFYYPDYQTGKLPLDEYRIIRFSKAMEVCGVSVTRQEAIDFQKQYLENQSRLCLSQRMQEILDLCKASGVWLGLMTNGPTHHQSAKIDALGLQRWIPSEHIFISEAVGCTKPDREIFAAAEKGMAQPVQEIYMVGDSYDKDMLGAINAGWRTVWMNHRRHPLPEGAKEPDYTAYSELELQKIFEEKFCINNG